MKRNSFVVLLSIILCMAYTSCFALNISSMDDVQSGRAIITDAGLQFNAPGTPQLTQASVRAALGLEVETNTNNNVIVSTPIVEENFIAEGVIGVVNANDLLRLVDVSLKSAGFDSAKIVNAKQLTANRWVIRIEQAGQTDGCNGDYVVDTLIAEKDKDHKIINAPTKDDTKKYGPRWYYAAVYRNNDVQGFLIARRITRFKGFYDLDYSTSAELNTSNIQKGALALPIISGSYDKPSDESFMEKLLNK